MLGDGRRHAESNEVARLLLILIVVVIGCGEADPSREAPAQLVDRVALLSFTGLEAGKRPKSIGGADYKEITSFTRTTRRLEKLFVLKARTHAVSSSWTRITRCFIARNAAQMFKCLVATC